MEKDFEKHLFDSFSEKERKDRKGTVALSFEALMLFLLRSVQFCVILLPFT